MIEALKIEIETTGAAFDGWDRPRECARILRDLAEQIENGAAENLSLWDVNGNRIGRATWETGKTAPRAE